MPTPGFVTVPANQAADVYVQPKGHGQEPILTNSQAQDEQEASEVREWPGSKIAGDVLHITATTAAK
jgi:hypothetical protein